MLKRHSQRGGLPRNLPSGVTAAQGGTADATQRDGRGLQWVDKSTSGLVKPIGALSAPHGWS
jgi:hypothetical protein